MQPPFPPTRPQHIGEYRNEEVVAGYREYHPAISLFPGPNHSPAYRWGWLNARRDFSGRDDGHDALRHRYLEWRKMS